MQMPRFMEFEQYKPEKQKYEVANLYMQGKTKKWNATFLASDDFCRIHLIS